MGHTTRIIPLIDFLIHKENKVVIAADGLCLKYLKQRFPKLIIEEISGYNIKYNKNMAIDMLLQLPKIILGIRNERIETDALVRKHLIDIVISDCRYGVFSKKIPSYFITHQLRFQLPIFLKFFEPLGDFFNIFMFRFYNYIIIPDIKELPNLTGDLSHKGIISKYSKLKYLGVFCNVSKLDINEDIDFLISISGPEIQRTLFEKLLLDQIDSLSGKIVVVLGKPGSDNSYRHKNVEIYNHVSRKKQNELLNRAKLIICRSGYTTVMELTALNKIALLIPTPGQTEQEYLAKYYKKTGLFNVAEQKKLNISKEIKKIRFDKKIKLLNIPINDVSAFEKLLEDE